MADLDDTADPGGALVAAHDSGNRMAHAAILGGTKVSWLEVRIQINDAWRKGGRLRSGVYDVAEHSVSGSLMEVFSSGPRVSAQRRPLR